jgi:hypothetical protein
MEREVTMSNAEKLKRAIEGKLEAIRSEWVASSKYLSPSEMAEIRRSIELCLADLRNVSWTQPPDHGKRQKKAHLTETGGERGGLSMGGLPPSARDRTGARAVREQMR